ncbi:GNAT family N-acetyltransferase [Algoriphagus litoralis]|uniref:GNAT family N-acetyltransferase n=1 Tax=Algoriphagus litoralis TaxID=2202829 RepID=UPI000DB9C43B|nr:GNAT family N-acetyltransferase [Algoriphagus litoralis]
MTHPLNNPIWNALNTGSAHFSHGNEQCRFIDPRMGFFAGMPSYEREDLDRLYAACTPGQRVILFTPGHLPLNQNWLVLNDRELLQMVCDEGIEGSQPTMPLLKLGEKDIPAMLELTELTKPGPFISRTIDFGGYFGVFEGEKLISMAGKRLSPDPFVEISAVCTHPDYLGKGLSAKVIQRVIEEIRADEKTPFLHVYPENTQAIKVYSKLGFKERAMLRVYLLEKI